jgi:cyclopropane-fatty-acyl-phospholipid synthase
MSSAERIITEMLAAADIRIDGARPWDLHVRDRRFFARIVADGVLGFGESYMDGWWETDALDELCFRASRAHFDERARVDWRTVLTLLEALVINRQTRRRARLLGRRHYDLGNDFFEAMLDPAMQYSCGFFHDTDDLTEAQERKMELICAKLDLHPGMRLLDIGCGWGGLARYAVERYDCRVVGITISQRQAEYAAQHCRGWPIEIRLQDYRDLHERFDRVVSVGMVEHVGFKNYRTYMRMVRRSLTDDGLFLCQSIVTPVSAWRTDPWISRYIFPNSILPSVSRLAKAAEGCFIIEDAQNFGASYDLTLLSWERNFRAAWPRFHERYGERFYRMWRFYLLGCAGAFRARTLELFQLVFSPHGVPGGYERPALEMGRAGFEPAKA